MRHSMEWWKRIINSTTHDTSGPLIGELFQISIFKLSYSTNYNSPSNTWSDDSHHKLCSRDLCLIVVIGSIQPHGIQDGRAFAKTSISHNSSSHPRTVSNTSLVLSGPPESKRPIYHLNWEAGVGCHDPLPRTARDIFSSDFCWSPSRAHIDLSVFSRWYPPPRATSRSKWEQ